MSSITELPSSQRLGNRIKMCEQPLISEKHRVLRPFGVTVPQYAALLVVAEHPTISSANLARRCGVTAQAMTGVVNLLEGRGLISRVRSDDHAKVLLIQLTHTGERLLREADKSAVEVERRLAGAFSTQDLEMFGRLLGTAVAVLSAGPAAPEPQR